MFWTRVFPNNNDAHPIFHPACAILGLALQIPVCLIHAPTVLYRLVLGNIISTKEASIQNLQYRQPCLSMGASTIQISANANQICETRVCQTTSTTQNPIFQTRNLLLAIRNLSLSRRNPHDCQTKCIRKTEPAMQNQLFSNHCCYTNYTSAWIFALTEKLLQQTSLLTTWQSRNPWRPNDPKMSPAQFSRFSRPFTSKWGALTSISRFFTRERFYGFLMFCMFFVCFSYLRKGIREGDWHGTLVGMNFGLTCHYIPAKPPNFNFCCFTSKITRVWNWTIS